MKVTLKLLGSDSFIKEVDVDFIPRKGEKLFINNSKGFVDEIEHIFNTEQKTHQIVVHYLFEKESGSK